MNNLAHRDLQRRIDGCSSLVRKTVQVIGSKWAAPILFALQSAPEPLRYAEIRRRVGAITPKELAKHLRALENAGLIGRKIHPSVPPKVEYWLTELGHTAAPVLAMLVDWGAHFTGLPPRACEICGEPGLRNASPNRIAECIEPWNASESVVWLSVLQNRSDAR